MLFIGHFSFDEMDTGERQRHGYFSSIVDAATPDDAVRKFEAHIRSMKQEQAEMAGVVNVYLEELLKVESIPETPLTTRFQSSEGEFPPSVSHALPGVDSGRIEAYGFTPDIENRQKPDNAGFVESTPFITFGR